MVANDFAQLLKGCRVVTIVAIIVVGQLSTLCRYPMHMAEVASGRSLSAFTPNFPFSENTYRRPSRSTYWPQAAKVAQSAHDMRRQLALLSLLVAAAAVGIQPVVAATRT
jgi:hypothetical protein